MTASESKLLSDFDRQWYCLLSPVRMLLYHAGFLVDKNASFFYIHAVFSNITCFGPPSAGSDFCQCIASKMHRQKPSLLPDSAATLPKHKEPRTQNFGRLFGRLCVTVRSHREVI